MQLNLVRYPCGSLRCFKKKGLCHFILIINTCLKSLLKSRSLDIPHMFLFVFSSGCKRSMNHLKEGLDHEAKHRCRYSAQYDNRIYTCKASTNPHNALMWMCTVRLAGRFWVSALNLSGLLWGREGGDCSPQNNGVIWLPLVWPGHLCLVWVSQNEFRDDRNSSYLSLFVRFTALLFFLSFTVGDLRYMRIISVRKVMH